MFLYPPLPSCSSERFGLPGLYKFAVCEFVKLEVVIYEDLLARGTFGGEVCNNFTVLNSTYKYSVLP